MIRRLLWFQLLFIFNVVGASLHAQNIITTQTLSLNSVCPGTVITINFTGGSGNINSYYVQLSDGGAYKDIISGSATYDLQTKKGTIMGGIPIDQAAGTTYSIRVNSRDPAIIGSPVSLTIKSKPTPPTVDAIQLDCQQRVANDAFTYVYFKKLANATAQIYDKNQKRIQQDAFYISDQTNGYFLFPKGYAGTDNGYVYPVSETTYSISQVVEGCESDKTASLIRTLYEPSGGPTPVNQTSAQAGVLNYCQGDKTYPLNVNGHSVPPTNYQVSYYYNNSSTTTPPTPDSSVPGSTQYLMRLVPIDATKGCPSPTAASTYLYVNVNARPAKPIVPVGTVSLCQYQSPISLTATGTNLVWYGMNATDGTGSVVATQPSTTTAGTFKYYVSQRINNCESERAEIVVEIKAASPTPTVKDVLYCQGYPASPLSATADSGGSLKWYISNSPGLAPLLSAPTPPTNNAATLFYYVTQTVGSACESRREVVEVYIIATPTAPSLTKTTYAFCQNSQGETLAPTGSNYRWYETLTSSTNLDTVTPSTSTPGSRQYFVSQTVNTCEGPRTPVTVTILEAPAAPTVAQTSYTFCQGTINATIMGTVASAGTTGWTVYGDAPGLLNSYTMGSTAYAIVPTSQVRSSTYSLNQTGTNGCKGPSSAQINVTVKASPSSPVVQAISVCQNAPVPTLPTDQGLLWYTSNIGGTGSATTPVISTSQTFQTTYYVSQLLNGCESQRSALSVTVNAIPSAPVVANQGLTYCQNTLAVSLSATGQGTLNWYKDSSGGTSLGNSPIPDTKTPGPVTYYVSQSINGCEGSRSAITVKVNPTPVIPVLINTTTSLCQFDAKPTVSFTSKGGYTVLVTRQASGGSLKDTTFQLTATRDTVMLSPNLAPTADAQTLTYRIKNQDSNGCISDQLSTNIVVNATPAAPSVQAQSVCQNAAAPTVTTSGSNLKYYTAQSGGTGSATPPTFGTSQPGTTYYYVSQTVGVCESARATLAITVTALPVAPSVTSPVNACQGSKADQLASNAQNPTWYYPDGAKIGPNAPSPITDQVATLNYGVTQTVNGCEGPKAMVTVNIVTTAPPTVTQAVVELCQNGNSQSLQATGIGQLKWVDPNGVVSTTAPAPPTTNATIKPDGDVYYVSQVGSNGCESIKVPIRVFVQTVPTLSITGTTTTNLGLEVPLKLTFTGVGPYRFKLSTGLTGTAVKDTTILFLANKTTTFQVAEVTNKCGTGLPGSGAVAVVTVRIPTIRTLAFTTTTVCAGVGLTTNFTTTGEFNAGSIFKLQIAKTDVDTSKAVFTDVPGSLFATGQYASSIPTTLASGTYWLRIIATNPKIPVEGSISPTVLIVKSLASATLTGTQSIYEGQPAKLSVAFAGDGPWSFMYKDSTASVASVTHSIQASTNPYTLEVRPSKTTAYFLTNVSNVCGDNFKTGALVVVSVSPLLGVDDLILSNALQVYPVPTSSTLTIRITGLLTTQLAKFELVDANGKLISQQESRHEISLLSLDQHPSGNYWLRVRVGERVATKRIVKL